MSKSDKAAQHAVTSDKGTRSHVNSAIGEKKRTAADRGGAVQFTPDKAMRSMYGDIIAVEYSSGSLTAVQKQMTDIKGGQSLVIDVLQKYDSSLEDPPIDM